MSSSSHASDPSLHGPSPVRGEIVREQTVRAPNPMLAPATEGTVKAPLPVAPVTEGTVRAPFPTAPVVRHEQTVRARIPTPDGIVSPADLEVELHDDELEVEDLDAVELEAEEVEPLGIDLVELDDDAPRRRSDEPTLPKPAAELDVEELDVEALDIGRGEPVAVAGEVSVLDAEPLGMFDPRPEPVSRRATEPAESAALRRDDPPAVAGEVAIVASSDDEPLPPARVSVMTTTGPQSVLPGSLAPSGPHPVLRGSSGSHPVLQPGFGHQGTDPGPYAGAWHETTGPQPVTPSEPTGPHPPMRIAERSDRLLWYVAIALVVLAVGGVVLVVSRAS